ncbi:hypothetical protein KR51_00033290 [Rubidibacter lacunae KORDI 51-2]|uniref:DUF4335 domain-containing protein n=1 Tax=Rubidibacter lacunae KORDI 51-2 TaxID=582515 RepID=U5DK41_9CHRO|nr:DUF4335 domain-containing protein [Rubidibacter lacunae]ERN40050.1 hypothetical protein KR51_00033290 [Rubidibacter lacunae KORDI 51-2]
MSIRRQYSLPNCTLTLDGWSHEADALELRPPLSILTGVECRFLGRDEHLSGDRDFLTNLVAAANAYAQALLSGIAPNQPDRGDRAISFTAGDDEGTHLLLVHAPDARMPDDTSKDDGDRGPGELLQVELTTVQLFDLVEAIDQFLTDRATLPDMSLELTPLPKHLRKPDKPLAERAKPAAIGAAGFVAAALAFYMLPVPETRAPESTEPQQESALDPSEFGAVGATFPDDIETVLATALTVSDAAEQSALGARLRDEIEAAWDSNANALDTPLEYRIWADATGNLLGYQALERSNRPLAAAPVLPRLVTPPDVSGTEPLHVAQFQLTFNPDGSVAIAPQSVEP